MQTIAILHHVVPFGELDIHLQAKICDEYNAVAIADDDWADNNFDWFEAECISQGVEVDREMIRYSVGGGCDGAAFMGRMADVDKVLENCRPPKIRRSATEWDGLRHRRIIRYLAKTGFISAIANYNMASSYVPPQRAEVLLHENPHEDIIGQEDACGALEAAVAWFGLRTSGRPLSPNLLTSSILNCGLIMNI